MSDKESRFFVGELTIKDRKRIANYIWKSIVLYKSLQNGPLISTLIRTHYLIYISNGCTISKKMYILRNLIDK